MPLEAGQILKNRYLIVKLLGKGGFGAVYHSQDTELDRPVALKENLDVSPEAQRQFQREARLLANLEHPNLPRVTDHFLLPGSGQYLVMDFVEGEDLLSMLDKAGGPLPEEQVIPWIHQVCDALDYLHNQSPPIIHRDIKPANIKITPQGKVKLVDFGIAKIYNPELRTTVGARAVTPGYSPPEQYGQATTDPRSDLYALGATIYHLLTGKIPPDSVDLLTRNAAAPIPIESLNPAVSPQVSLAVNRAMQLERTERWSTAQEFKQSLVLTPASTGLPDGVNYEIIGKDRLASYSEVVPPTKRISEKQATVGIAGLVKSEIGGRRRRPAFIIGGTVLALVLIAVVMFTFIRLFSSSPESSSAVQVSTKSLSASTPTIGSPSQDSLQIANPATEKPAVTFTSTPTSGSGSNQVSDIDGMPLIFIPAGEFKMGSSDSDSKALDSEKPQHSVYLDAYWIDQTEVTNLMFSRFIEDVGYLTEAEKEGWGTTFNLSTEKWEQTDGADWRHPRGPTSDIIVLDHHPVVQVSWNDARAYCLWAGRNLPTEAEWEKAARGTSGSLYSWGNQPPTGDLANFADSHLSVEWANQNIDDGYQFTAPTGIFLSGASPFGLLDMTGNVWEWVWDWFKDTYYTYSPASNPMGPETGEYRALRGGGWNSPNFSLRAAYRYPSASQVDRYDDTGFRFAMSSGD